MHKAGAGKQPRLSPLGSLLNWIYPPRCMLCEDLLDISGPKWICGKCSEIVGPIMGETCPKCGQPSKSSDIYEGACADCFGRDLKFDRNVSVFVYEEPVREMIHRFKYHGRPRYAYGFAQLTVNRLGTDFFKNTDALVPVPMYAAKRRKRGYDQSLRYASALSELTGVPVCECLVRVKDTKPQSGLTPAERRHNINDAFIVDKKLQISLKRLMIIDDIYTTGETISACAYALMQGGASEAAGLTLSIAAKNV